jgi:hypothetical protein
MHTLRQSSNDFIARLHHDMFPGLPRSKQTPEEAIRSPARFFLKSFYNRKCRLIVQFLCTNRDLYVTF